jgi:DNA adenine methylase
VDVLTVHPVPYQGSKRRLAPQILAHFPATVATLYEPFAGSAAVSLAAARYGRAERFHLNDSLRPLMELWRQAVDEPAPLADGYEQLWAGQGDDPRAFYDAVRRRFNERPTPAALLFLLARCVKNAVRFNAEGAFNQSPDNRRRGTRPARMRRHLLDAHRLLGGRTTVSATDYAAVLRRPGPRDLVYMDPPYQGTSGPRDPRYHEPLDRERFVAELRALRSRGVPFLISFDGRCGDRTYGAPLPDDLGLTRLDVAAGRSSQATLSGRTDQTVESLYLSPELASR